MNQNKLSFANENLVVDHISFKFQYLEGWKKSISKNCKNYIKIDLLHIFLIAIYNVLQKTYE